MSDHDQRICDDRNRALTRKDIEWAVGAGGIYLRDKPEWTAQRTRQMDATRERERQIWLANYRREQARDEAA